MNCTSILYKFSILLVCLFLYIENKGQELAVEIIPPEAREIMNIHFSEPEFYTKDSLKTSINNAIDSLRNAGYLGANLESIAAKDEVWQAIVYLGKQYAPGSLNNGNIDSTIFADLKIIEATKWQDVERFKQEILQKYLAQGFLNAAIRLDDIELLDEKVNGAFYISSTKSYTLGEILVSGDVEVTPAYLNNYFNLEPGQEINPTLLKEIQLKANQSYFFALEEPPAFILNTDGSADITLNLKQVKANQFDIILGFLPNPNPQLSDKKLLLTGEGKLDLYNPLGGGRRLNVAYHQLQPESPRFNLSAEWPYIFKGILGLTGDFNLYKQDTIYVDVNYKFGANYHFGQNNKLLVYFNKTTNFLQEIDTAFVRINQSLPQSIDYKQNLYGVELTLDKRDNFRSPKKGYRIIANPAVGNRTIDANRKVTEVTATGFDYTTLYNNVNDNKLTIHGNITIEGFVPLGDRSTLLLRNRNGFRFYENYFVNDLYRLGGLKTIRGFDEESEFASKYATATAEYRYFLGRESFISIFSDGGYLYNDREQDSSNVLLGLGSGINLATDAGVFSFSLAVGKDGAESFNLNRSRIHIGYINVF